MIGQRKSGFLLPVMLVTACGTLLWMVVSLILAPEAEFETVSAKPAKVTGLDGLAAELKFSMPPISHYEAILDRPIFSASRRGAAEVAAPTIVVSRELKLKLTGTSITDTEKYALLAPQDGGDVLRLREGEDYQGWTLARVKLDTVVFRRSGAEERLTLDYVEPPAQISKKNRNRRATARRDRRQPLSAAGQDRQGNRNDLRNRNLRTLNPDDDEEGEEDEENLRD